MPQAGADGLLRPALQPPVADGLLRPALQLAMDLARVGARSSPAIEAPRAVRPLLQFAGRLPDAALVAVRRGLDEDGDFRERVAALADEEELGRAGWLFVVRPEGWEIELAALSEEAESLARAASEEREERSARRRLAHAEEATKRAETAAGRARAELAAVNAELATGRRERRTAQDEAARLARRVTSLEGERNSAHRRAGEASADAEALRAEAEGLRAELAQVRATLGAVRAEAEAEALRARADRLRTDATGPSGGGRGAAAGPEGGVADVPAAARAVADVPAAARAVADVPAVARAVAAAAAAASALGRALDEASAALAPPVVSEGAGPPGGGAGGSPPVRGRGQPPQSRRRPVGLPPAVFDDTPDAAAHLVRVPDVVVLVDGYNAAKALWPDVAPLELRERLVDALSELVARTGAGVHVVYDGADLGLPQSRPVSRRGVRISFSPPDVEADDVILELVEAVPLDRAVVVASSDRRVQDGARRRGANVISSAQLAAVLGRS